MKAQARPSVDPAALGGGALLVLLYIFLYAPIFYVIYTSFAEDIVWPFPPSFSLTSYEDLFASSLYAKALSNSGSSPRSADAALRGTPSAWWGASRRTWLSR